MTDGRITHEMLQPNHRSWLAQAGIDYLSKKTPFGRFINVYLIEFTKRELIEKGDQAIFSQREASLCFSSHNIMFLCVYDAEVFHKQAISK